MKTALFALALICAAPAAFAQPHDNDGNDYWRRPADAGHPDWRRREEFREQARREDWLRSHCVRDWQGHEFCRQ